MIQVTHFVRHEDVDILEELFTASEKVIYVWPLAHGEIVEERMEWPTPDWVHLMRATVRV